MTTNAVKTPIKAREIPDDDKELQDALKTLVDKVLRNDPKLIAPSLKMLKFLIQTATTSTTSVPKPLKYLSPYYLQIKNSYNNIKDPYTKRLCADIISVLAMGPIAEENIEYSRDCLKCCMLGSLKNISDWGHEYIRQLETEIVKQTNKCPRLLFNLENLIKDIVRFDCKFHAEIQACDLLMTIDRLEFLPEFIDESIYSRICLYLQSCAKYEDEIKADKILNLVCDQYIRFSEYSKALIVAIDVKNSSMVDRIFKECTDVCVLKQLAFIAARQLYPIELDADVPDRDEIVNILNNNYLYSNFQSLARELDILEPIAPEDVYKTWLEPTPPLRTSVLPENVDSACQNLVSSFVTGLVNAGFGSDKLLTTEGGYKWIYRNEDHGMLSATAALGLLYLWDVDGGLTHIDKYLCSKEDQIKAGALLALGIVTCRVRNECEPALALLADFVNDRSSVLQNGSVFGLGLAYTGTDRADVLDLLLPAIDVSKGVESFAVASLACGLVAIGTCNAEVSQTILTNLVDWREHDRLKSPHSLMAVLGLGFCYMGCKDAIKAPIEILKLLPEPFCSTSKAILYLCSYAGTANVFIIKELLKSCGKRIVLSETQGQNNNQPKTTSDRQLNREKEHDKKFEWDPNIAQAAAVLGLGTVAMGDETGSKMSQRVLGSVGCYGDPYVRRAVPLGVALNSVSKPDFSVVDLLTKYSYDADDKVACNSIFALGIVGAGTNNARLAATLRELAVYHAKNPSELCMVRLAQGLTLLGKGTMTLSPWHTDRLLIDHCTMAGLLIPMVALLEPHSMILGQRHYFMYGLAAAIQPRWLLTVDEKLKPITVPVRVGQAVDIIGKADTPITIAGIHTHSTPVLLRSGERAELATNEYEQLSSLLDGVCILKKKSEDIHSVL